MGGFIDERGASDQSVRPWDFFELVSPPANQKTKTSVVNNTSGGTRTARHSVRSAATTAVSNMDPTVIEELKQVSD